MAQSFLLSNLALPLALSGDLASTFLGTNKNTGILEWLERNPRVSVGLAERIDATAAIVTEAIRFGCFTRALALADGARLLLGPFKPKKSAVKGLGEDTRLVLKRGERLGYWFAMAGSTRAVFGMLDISV